MIQEFERINTESGELIVRRYETRDIPVHGAYLFGSPKEFLESIGFDTAKLDDREEWEAAIRKRHGEASRTGDSPNVVVAELGGRAISMVFVNRQNEDNVPRLHFHIFGASYRGKGLGGPIFKAGARAFSRIYGIERFLIEPKASNARMNGLMRKLGFKHLQDFLLPAGPVTQEMTVSQYEVMAASLA